jgi:cytochrome o ubiquinol oxidase subunit 2
MLQPAGPVARQQRDLLYFALALSALVVLPVFALTGWIAWKYRAGNKKAVYAPEWDRNVRLETLWWGIPCLIILVLAVVTWQTSHSLDPRKPLAGTSKPMTIQVVALQWKWLFLYPEQQVATVNYVTLPVDRPVRFEITSDAPMNSFWIPRLGGQIYAMSGMTTYLQLQADRAGDFSGASANISGSGFADMHFKAQARMDADFTNWLLRAKTAASTLTESEYTALAQPATIEGTRDYAAYDRDLYDKIMRKYTGAGH